MILKVFVIFGLISIFQSCAETSESSNAETQGAKIIAVEDLDGGLRVITTQNEYTVSFSSYNSYKYSNNILAVQYSDQGERIQAFNANGDRLLSGAWLIDSYQVADNIVAIEYYDQGQRVKAYNANGKSLLSGALVVDSYQVADNIVAIKYYDQGQRVKAYDKDGNVLLSGADLVQGLVKSDGKLIVIRNDGSQLQL